MRAYGGDVIAPCASGPYLGLKEHVEHDSFVLKREAVVSRIDRRTCFLRMHHAFQEESFVSRYRDALDNAAL
jgi:hypothetical protein